jgi:TRAP-type C4-dicarboxylate transport system permease small subunit
VLERIEALAARALGALASVSLFAMMAVTFVDVIGRYGFHRSVFGAAEIIEQLMMVTVFAGLAFITARNEHITVSLLDGIITRGFDAPRRWLSIALSVGSTALITWQMFAHALDLLRSGKRTAVLDLPQWTLPMSAAALSLVGFALLVIAVWRTQGRLGATAPAQD